MGLFSKSKPDSGEAQPNTAANEEGVELPAPEGGTTIAGVTLTATQLPLFIVLVASIVLLIATTSFYGSISGSYARYAVSVSCITMILSFFALVLAKFKEDVYAKIGKHINMLNFVWGFLGACFLTFDEPFTTTGNGFFAAWAVVFGSAMAMGMTANAFQSSIKGLGAVMGLLASSLVLIVATIRPVRDGINKGEAIYAMVLGCITFVFILVAISMEKKEKAMHPMVYFASLAILAICWILEACFVTFRGPFTETGNGYFASWAGAGTSTMAAFVAEKAM
ncbi:hypothetical protein ACHAXT_009645 [Thalassiosira profunda]